MIDLPAGEAGALAVGWATVELDRAARELAGLLAPGSAFEHAPASAILGARCRVGRAGDGTDRRIVLLEPDTEGRLAATLARSGEGWVATWVVDRGTGAPATSAPSATPGRLSASRPGPLGEERLLLGGPLTGPHRLFVEAVPSPS